MRNLQAFTRNTPLESNPTCQEMTGRPVRIVSLSFYQRELDEIAQRVE